MEPIAATPSETPVKKRAPRTRSALLKRAEKKLLEKGEDIAEEWAKQLLEGVKKREKGAMEMVARMLHGDKGPGGINLTQQTMNINAAAEEKAAGARSFEAIVRRLELKDKNRALLTEPTPIRRSEPNDLPIIDAETVS